MNSLADIAEHLAALFQTGEYPEELLSGMALRSPVGDDCCVQLRLQPLQQRWMLGVDCSDASLDDAAMAQWQENLLRVAHASRWEAQRVGMLDMDGTLALVDCDFPGTPQQAAEIASAPAIEGRLQGLLDQLAALRATAPDAGWSADADAPPNRPGDEASGETSNWLKA